MCGSELAFLRPIYDKRGMTHKIDCLILASFPPRLFPFLSSFSSHAITILTSFPSSVVLPWPRLYQLVSVSLFGFRP